MRWPSLGWRASNSPVVALACLNATRAPSLSPRRLRTSATSCSARALCFSLHKLVEPDPEKPGDDLELATPLAVASRTKVGGDRLGWLVRHSAVVRNGIAKCGREALLVLPPGHAARPRLAVRNDG